MSKYGYVSLDMLYEYAMNTVDKTVSPNEFMRMSKANVIPIEWIKDYVGSGVSDDTFQRNRRFVLNMLKDGEKENE